MIPQIGNDKWWYIVGGVTIAFIFFASIGSMIASGQAAWEDMSQANK